MQWPRFQFDPTQFFLHVLPNALAFLVHSPLSNEVKRPKRYIKRKREDLRKSRGREADRKGGV